MAFPKKQIFILPLVLISLLLGIWTGWIRLGWPFPLASMAPNHGAIMVGSFVGTLICLERALGFTTFKYGKFALIIPALSSLSIFFFIINEVQIAAVMLLAGSAGLVFMYLLFMSRFGEIHLILMMAGACCWVIGNAILLKTSFYPSAVMWWIAFVFFTITGERLELSKYLNVPVKQKYLLSVFMLIYIAAIFIPFHDFGGYVAAFSLISSALWLFKYDMAKKSLQKEGQHFFSGFVLLTGYCWLIICGLFLAYGSYSGLLYDPAVHSFFLGFVFSMVFAHAPIILPGVLKLAVNPFSKLLYIWFGLLQISLILRISGSLTGIIALKHSGGLFNGIAILGFFVTIFIVIINSKRKLSPV